MVAGAALNTRAKARVTIQEVARRAGVSTGTVSRVLNDRRGVRAETKEAVLAAIEQLDYRPSLAARELSFRQTTRIGLHIARSSRRLTPFFMLFLEHLLNELQSDGYRLEEIPTRKDGLPQTLTDGMVLFGVHDDDPRVAFLRSQGVPFVLIGHYPESFWVAPDDRDGGLQATRHLLRLGHQAILHLGGPLQEQVAYDRYAGYQDALHEAGLETRHDLVLNGDFSSLGAYRVLRRAFEAGLRFSAVFAASDEMAVGVVKALEDLGLRVPNDVSVVGFDDLPEIGEELTTVRQDISQIAAQAVRLLKEGLSGAPPRHTVVPVHLIVRGTTAKRR